MKISASILSIKNNLKDELNKLVKTDISLIHLDIMDGIFVSNKTWNIDEVKTFLNNSKPLDIHLMVSDVYKYVDEFKVLKPKYITFHLEAIDDAMEAIKYIKSLGINVGLSIKPDTRVEKIIPYLPFIDLVLVMSVEPGRGGQKFIENSISKIDKLKQLRGEYNYLIEVDGGINNETISLVKNADIAVVGSFLTSGDYNKNLELLKERI